MSVAVRCAHLSYLAACLLGLVLPSGARGETTVAPPALVPLERHPRRAPLTVLVTHPRASTLHFFETLVREKIWQVDDLHIVGIFHALETEDYQDADAYIRAHHLDWVTLRRVDCAVSALDLYARDTCKAEFAALVAMSSGIVFGGGPDIPPALYGRETLLTTVIEAPHRHIFEISLLYHLLGGSQDPNMRPLLADRPDYPVLGICVGMQSMAVAAGGQLVQDIPSEIYGVHTEEALLHADPATLHRNVNHILNPAPDVGIGVLHPITLTARAPAPLIGALSSLRTHPTVLSLHHQAVLPGHMGKNYVVTATSLDGKVVEGIHHAVFPHVWGWQFHPERSLLWDPTELERPREGEPPANPAVKMLAAEGASRAFNRGVWELFAADLRRAYKTQVK